MPLSAEEYDALTPDAQRAHDAAEAERERAEQAALPYRWTQALDHVEVSVPVPEGTRAKQVRVDFGRTRLCVVVHGTTIVEVRAAHLTQGELAKPVRPDDCTWTIGTRRGSRRRRHHARDPPREGEPERVVGARRDAPPTHRYHQDPARGLEAQRSGRRDTVRVD